MGDLFWMFYKRKEIVSAQDWKPMYVSFDYYSLSSVENNVHIFACLFFIEGQVYLDSYLKN